MSAGDGCFCSLAEEHIFDASQNATRLPFCLVYLFCLGCKIISQRATQSLLDRWSFFHRKQNVDCEL